MTFPLYRKRILSAGLSAAALALVGCQNGPISDYDTSPVDTNPASVQMTTDVLKVDLPATRNGLTAVDKRAVEHFVSRYEDVGRGELIVTSPAGGANAQQALKSVADIRRIAHSRGVEYDQVSVRTYDADGVAAAPMMLAFKRYEAIAPDCPLLSQIDMSDVANNAELSTIGCAVNANLAAMIADPADLRGDREITATDTTRSDDKTQRYQAGDAIESASSVNATLGQ